MPKNAAKRKRVSDGSVVVYNSSRHPGYGKSGDIAKLFMEPAITKNIRLRTDHSAYPTALASLYQNLEFFFGALDPTSTINPLVPIIIFTNNPFAWILMWIVETALAGAYVYTKSITNSNDLVGISSWIYYLVSDLNGTNLKFQIDTGEASYQQLTPCGMSAGNDNIPYDVFQVAMEHEGKRYLWVDSGQSLAGGAASYTTWIAFSFLEPGGTFWSLQPGEWVEVDIYQWNQGADTHLCSVYLTNAAVITNTWTAYLAIPIFSPPAGYGSVYEQYYTADPQAANVLPNWGYSGTTYGSVTGSPLHLWNGSAEVQWTTATPGLREFHDFIRFEVKVGYNSLSQDYQLSHKVGSYVQVAVFGNCSALNRYPLPDLFPNKLPFVDEIKVTGVSANLENDTAMIFRNGRFACSQLPHTTDLSALLALATQNTNLPSNVANVGFSSSQIITAIENYKNRQTFENVKGVYGFFKPNKVQDLEYWETGYEAPSPFSAANTKADPHWKMDRASDYCIITGINQLINANGYQPLTPYPQLMYKLQFNANVEYKTNDKWVDQTGNTTFARDQVDKALEEIRPVPQWIPTALPLPAAANVTK